MIRLYNTLTRKKENFETLEPNVVKLYVCGVTVYNDAHVGHAMSALVFDIIRRYLEYRGYNVKHVMNYTDVDDKIINRAKQLNEDPLELSQRYIEDYANDLKSLNVLPATSNPQVSKTMPLIIEFIQGLIQRKAAYAAPNGDVYFSVTSDDDYGKLSGRKLDDMQAGARIEVEELKNHPMDFALWKAAKPASHFEALGLSLIEATACGLPIVTTDTPGCRDVVTNGVNGLLVPVKDAQAVADALELLINDPDLRRRMGSAGRELAINFSNIKINRETLAVYSLLTQSPSDQ